MVIEFAPKPQPASAVDKTAAEKTALEKTAVPRKPVEANDAASTPSGTPARPKSTKKDKKTSETSGELF